VNKQVHHIIYAHLILVALAATFLLIRNIPFEINQQNTEAWCSTEDSKANLSLTSKAAQGKSLFMSKCASCHNLFKDGTGPGLIGFEERGKWADRNELYKWIKNPSAYMKNDSYTHKLKTIYGSMMTGFPDISNEEIDAICDYINQSMQGYSMPIADK
jgi:cytochrome c2